MKKLFLAVLICLFFAGPVSAASVAVTATVTAENSFTDAISPAGIPDVSRDDQEYGTLTLTISGTWEATVSLQVAYDGGTTWIDTGHTWTEPTTQIITCYEHGVSFRAGVKTGDFTSGTVNVRLSR